MFNCDICGETVSPKVPCKRIVIETRQRSYPFRNGVNRIASWKDEKNDRDISSNDSGGQGWEIVKEARCCPNCAVKTSESVN